MNIAVILVALTGLNGQVVYVNPYEIVSVRAPNSDLLHQDIKCALQTADGRLVNVIETCEEVLHKIEKAEE